VKGTDSRLCARNFTTQGVGGAYIKEFIASNMQNFDESLFGELQMRNFDEYLFGEVLLPLGCGMMLRACTPLYRAVKRFFREHGYEAAGEEQSNVAGGEGELGS
jgi:hypothetical protein